MEWQSRFNEALIDVARHADVRISVARWQQDYLRSVHDIDTVYIPNGVDVASTELASASRFSNPFPGERFILYVGRNDPVKNPADYVRLAQRLPRQRFVMAGRGLSRDVMETEWSVSVPANLAVVGELAHASALDAIAASAALVVTSHREGLPTLVLEAMSLSKPTVVPDELGSVEAAGNGEFAMIYKPLDVDDLAEKVEAVISGPSVIAGARERVLGEYDWRVVARQLDAIYTDGAS
jgi:glycosyltransferase involved in cell wall biosynthesis